MVKLQESVAARVDGAEVGAVVAAATEGGGGWVRAPHAPPPLPEVGAPVGIQCSVRTRQPSVSRCFMREVRVSA